MKLLRSPTVKWCANPDSQVHIPSITLFYSVNTKLCTNNRCSIPKVPGNYEIVWIWASKPKMAKNKWKSKQDPESLLVYSRSDRQNHGTQAITNLPSLPKAEDSHWLWHSAWWAWVWSQNLQTSLQTAKTTRQSCLQEDSAVTLAPCKDPAYILFRDSRVELQPHLEAREGKERENAKNSLI